MIVNIEAYAEKPVKTETGELRAVNLYAYTSEESHGDGTHGGDTVRDANHALAIVERLGGGNIKTENPPQGDVIRLWTVQLQVSGTRRGHSAYRAAYHKETGCPLAQIDYMMTIYHSIKKVLRECREDLKREQAEKKAAKRKAKEK